jgi:hypothetical protein
LQALFLPIFRPLKKRSIILPVILLALVFVVFLIRRWNEPVRKEAFDRRPARVVYTRHALCRMDCRRISKAEIEEIMQKGVINFSKSNRMARPCPTFALQGRTSKAVYLRVIFSQCHDETKVVTAYNLEDDLSCDCPGEIKKERQ